MAGRRNGLRRPESTTHRPAYGQRGKMTMQTYRLEDLIERCAASGRPYLEFQRSIDLSSGLYVLPAGGTDHQQPHTEDEIYYVVAGRSMVRVGDEDAPVRPGTIIFVPVGVPHRFHSIEEELRVLVVFGPSEGSRDASLGG
jgi:mannose-6-phosphate isomerase-like protein (cupin superfamily)